MPLDRDADQGRLGLGGAFEHERRHALGDDKLVAEEIEDDGAEAGDGEAEFPLATQTAAVGGVVVILGDLRGETPAAGELSGRVNQLEIGLEVIGVERGEEIFQQARLRVKAVLEEMPFEVLGGHTVALAVQFSEGFHLGLG